MSVDIKSANKEEIADIIRKYGPVSVKEITTISRLSVPCVTKHINDMLDQGILTETVDANAAVGRKPKVYAVNPEYRNIVAVDLGSPLGKIGIADLSGRLLFDETCAFVDKDEPNTCMDRIIRHIREMLQRYQVDLDTIGCIVIGNPGAVDPESGRMRLSASFAVWHELPIRKIFMDAFGKQVLVYNDVNLSAIGENIYGVGKGYDNFIYIRDDVGLKAGIVINGILLEGEHHAAGEFGLNYLLGERIPDSDLSNISHVESKLSMEALLGEIRRKMSEHPADILWELAPPQRLTLEMVEKALNNSSTFVWELVRTYARVLAVSVANLVLTLDIGLIVFGGEIVRFNQSILNPMRQMLTQLLDYPPTVILSELEDRACLYGAISKGQAFIHQNFI